MRSSLSAHHCLLFLSLIMKSVSSAHSRQQSGPVNVSLSPSLLKGLLHKFIERCADYKKARLCSKQGPGQRDPMNYTLSVDAKLFIKTIVCFNGPMRYILQLPGDSKVPVL